MSRRRTALPLLLLLLPLAVGAACDEGSSPLGRRDAAQRAPDLPRWPDGQRPADTHALDNRAPDTRAPDARAPDTRAPDAPPKLSCTANGLTFTATMPAVACQPVTITIVGFFGYTYVTAGVRAAGGQLALAPPVVKVPADGSGTCPTGGCVWEVTVNVPCAPGPYAFGLLAQGTVVGECVP